MKKIIFLFVSASAIAAATHAQQSNQQDLQTAVEKLSTASNIEKYKQLESEFVAVAESQKTNWLPWYYAALCNAKIGWLLQHDGDLIEPYVQKADEQIQRSLLLLDTATQKRELSEVYCILSMIKRANVFINPMTYGRKYGPAASQYIEAARKINPENPRALYLAGWEKYYTPKMWGGDKKKAKELLELSSQRLSTQQVSDGYPSWGKKEVEETLRKL